MQRRFGVGIVGLEPGRSWAARAHLPALRALPDMFEIVGVANTSKRSAEAAARATGLSRSYASVAEMMSSSDVDIVTVAVKVPAHFEVVRAAIDAGKHVYCEWPLGDSLAQAEELALLARRHRVLAVVGTQARASPEVEYLKRLLSDGFIGELLSTTLVARGGAMQGGGAIPTKKTFGYLLDRKNGATMLTVPVGHAIAALTDLFGDLAHVSSVLAVRRPVAIAEDTRESLAVTAPDQVLIVGCFASGMPMSLHYRGGAPLDDNGLYWEIHGTDGDIRISGPSGQIQMVPLTLHGARRDRPEFVPLRPPRSDAASWPDDPEAGNVARLYARMADDLRFGTRSAPTFEDAVELHRVIAAVEDAAKWGSRVTLGARS